jgi:hypothetical protein
MPTPPAANAHRLPAGVWVLGGVSLLMDISSEMVHSLLPLFLAGTLGVSVALIGLIEGVAESMALMTKVFSGALSDYLGRRKGLAGPLGAACAARCSIRLASIAGHGGSVHRDAVGHYAASAWPCGACTWA